MVETRSATKGPTSTCLHLLVDRQLVDLDAPVRQYWPELRADPLVRHVLTHEAGVPVIDTDLPANAILDWQCIADAVAVQAPEWEPGERHGYHGLTFGWLVGEIVRRVTGRSIGTVLRDEITGPLEHRVLHRHSPPIPPASLRSSSRRPRRRARAASFVR